MPALELSVEAHTWLIDTLRSAIANLYDDPFGEGDLEDIHKEVEVLHELSTKLGLEYQQVVLDETTPFERARMNIILAHKTMSDDLFEQIELLR